MIVSRSKIISLRSMDTTSPVSSSTKSSNRVFNTLAANFLPNTFLSPLLFVGMAVLVGYLSTMNKDSVTQIAIHDEAGLLRKEFKNYYLEK